MKSAHRHELQTNELAQRLEQAITRFRPYASMVAGIVVAIVVVMFIWSYLSTSSAARRNEAWDAYHRSVTAVPPDLDQLRQAAEQYPGTMMQEVANITWADGQVLQASRMYVADRRRANESLRRAASAYQSILQSTNDEQLTNRAHLGLARVYEMQNQLDKAREEYLKVGGGYEVLAEQQAARLEKPETKEAYAWLASAEAPRLQPPSGPGTPGEAPEFSPGDIALPGEGATGPALPGAEGISADSFDQLIQGLQLPMTEDSASGAAPASETDAATPTDDTETAEETAEPAETEASDAADDDGSGENAEPDGDSDGAGAAPAPGESSESKN